MEFREKPLVVFALASKTTLNGVDVSLLVCKRNDEESCRSLPAKMSVSTRQSVFLQPEPPSGSIDSDSSTFPDLSLFFLSPTGKGAGSESRCRSIIAIVVGIFPIICVAVVVVYVCAKMEGLKEASNSKGTLN
ncbi:hypothetical protein TNCV_2743271 [Trichonephila clavipes]|nr:hypothetical protein TNCV_2743271 [Trichonephila clavipes]